MASYKDEPNISVVFLPLTLFALSSSLALLSLKFAKNFFHDNTKNILAFSAGTDNTGYFGIPLAIMLLDENLANIYIFTVLASLLYKSTVGFFVVAKGHYSIKQSLIKVIKIPSLYAVLGMMMIGMGLKGFKNVGIDKIFMSFAFGIKFIIYPLCALLIIWIDSSFFHFFSPELYKVIFIFSIVPMAGNTVAVASLLKVHPEKAALAVVLSTFISIFTIPIMLALFMP